MAVFLSTYEMKVDRKGRVSVPAPFRTVLAKQSSEGTASGLVIFRSLQFSTLEACSPEHMEKLAADLETMDLPPEERDRIEMTIFGDSIHLTLDPEGRILLPQQLLDHANIAETAAFVGRSKIFQIWSPEALKSHANEARVQSKASGISLSSITSAGRRRAVE
jgi:MraZ protein